MLTDQKARYAEGRVKGMSKRDAAVFAGCPPKTAQNAASRYEKDTDVIEAIRRLNHGQPLPASAPAVNKAGSNRRAIQAAQADRPKAMDMPALPDIEPLPVTDDPKVWLRALMNNETQPIKERNAAARKLAELEAKVKPEVEKPKENRFRAAGALRAVK
jgi:phage terminase small subunit